jgi:NADPH:quinone reductase-like Zn-dependent oxidoreductase
MTPEDRTSASEASGISRVVASAGAVQIVSTPVPRLRSGEILVATEHSVISPGTERTIIEATRTQGWLSHEYPAGDQDWPVTRSAGVRKDLVLPRAPATDWASLGYSVAGRAIAVAGDVTDILPGDAVACAGSQCAFHAEQVAVPRSLAVPVPQGLGSDKAAFVTLGAISLEALRRSARTLGETIVVFGCGVLGILATMLARAAGIYVIVVDPQPERREVGLAAGAIAALAGSEADLGAQVRGLTGGFGADAVIVTVTTEDSAVVNAALDSLRQGGVIVGVGQFGMSVDRDRWFGAQATFVPSVAYGPGRYDPVYEENNWDYPVSIVRWTENRNMAAFLRLAAEGAIDLNVIPVDTLAFRDAPAAYARLAAARLPLTGVLCYHDSARTG